MAVQILLTDLIPAAGRGIALQIPPHHFFLLQTIHCLYTAEKMFDLIDVKMNVQDLFKPENSVLLGAAYLKKLSVELDYQKKSKSVKLL